LSGKQARSKEIIRQTVGSATDKVCGGRRHYDRVRFAGKSDVVEGVSGPEDLRVHRAAGNRLEGDRAHEFPRGAGHHHIYFSARLCKQTRQPH
jgi:hypothetical protein